jgi:hypothetical protein
MSAPYWLREEAAEIDRSIERLTREIEDLESDIVKAREKRETLRFHRAEMNIAADFLDNNGFKVERDAFGGVTVSIASPDAVKP